MRPIRPEDEPALRRFADEVGAENLWHPFFSPLRARTHETAARLSQTDYDREMTLVAWDGEQMAGLARSADDPDFENSECAVIVREAMRERGLEAQLLEALLLAVAAQGVRSAVLVFPADQPQMLALCKEFGFMIGPSLRDASQARAVKGLHDDV